MKKLHILIVVFLISLAIFTFENYLVKADTLAVNVSPGLWNMDVGQSETFLASASGGSGNYTSYQWYIGGSAQSGQTAPTFNYSPGSTGSYSITATVTDNTSVTSAQSTAASVTVVSSPTVSIAPTGSFTMDVGQSKTFTATASGGYGAIHYQWYVGTGTVGTGSSSYIYTASGTSASVTCKVTDSASTPVTSPASNAVSVTVNSALVAPTVTPTPGTVTQGQTCSLTSSSITTGTSPYTYQWLEKAPGGNYANVGSNSATFSFVTSGSTATGVWSFELQVTDSTLAEVISNPASVTVNVALTVSVSPTSWTMDVGQSKGFTATPAGGSGSYTSYQWYVGGSAQSSTTSSTFSYFPTSSGSYSITATVTDSLGTTSTQSSTASVAVSASPTVSITPVVPLTMDAGQSQTFTATPSGGSGTIHFQWYLDSGAVGTDSSSYSYTAAATSHTVSCKATDSASVPVTSVASNSVSVTVNSALTISVSPSTWTMDIGQSKTFTASALGGSGSLSYQWYLAGSPVSGQTGTSYGYTASSASSPTIYVKVTDQASSPSTVQSNTPSITVNSAPTASITPSSWIMDIGQSKTFTASPTGGSGSYTGYQWYIGGSFQTGQTGSTFNFSPASSSQYSITVTVTDSLGTTSVQSSVDSISVSASPSVNIAPVGPLSLDVGQVQTFTATTSGGSGVIHFQWFLDGNIVGSDSSSYSFTAAGASHSVTCRVTDSASISVTSPASNAVSVTVNGALAVSIGPSSWAMDVGQSKMFTATPSGGSGSYISYQWYVSGSAQSGATGSTFSFVAGSAGSYSLSVTFTDSLGSTSAMSSAVSVSVSANPTVNVAPTGPISLDVGQAQVFAATPSGGSGSLSYQWYLGSSAVSGATSSTYSFSGSIGSYSVTCRVTDSASVRVISPASNAVSVTVNSALIAPTVTPTPSTITQGQNSSLGSSSMTTGTSPYTYQWFDMVPGGTYVMVGSNSASFSFVTSIATATGSWSFILQVKDNAGTAVNSSAVSIMVNIPPLDHFIFSSFGPQTAGTSFNITITAKDASNNTLTNYAGTNSLNVSTGTINPISTGVFSNGVWTDLVTVTGAGLGVTIFTSGSGMFGTSGAFTVNPGVLNHFAFDAIGDQKTGSAFNITVTANDASNNTVTGYSGSPTLKFSAGPINPSTMNNFVNGVGSTSVTVTTPGSEVTISATDGSHTGLSNSFTVTLSPTLTPTPTSTPTPTESPSPGPTQTPTPTPTISPKPSTIPSPTPSPTPNPSSTAVNATTDNGTTISLTISGNVTSSQLSNVTISTNQSAKSTTVSFTITGQSGTTGFCNLAIPKTAISYGTVPVIFIDGQQSLNQGFTQDVDNFYVWYTTQFSTHQVTIQFTAPTTSPGTSLRIEALIVIIVVVIVLISAAVVIRRKNEN